MITKKERANNHKTVIHLIPNYIVYQIEKIFNIDDRGFQGLMLMILIWLMGFSTGAIWTLLKFVI